MSSRKGRSRRLHLCGEEDAHLLLGFAGAMIDTFDKRSRGLRQHLSDARLRAFVEVAKDLGLLTGLAGSLRLQDIAELSAVNPDLLGFRGALCQSADRNGSLCAERVQEVRATLDRAGERPVTHPGPSRLRFAVKRGAWNPDLRASSTYTATPPSQKAGRAIDDDAVKSGGPSTKPGRAIDENNAATGS